MSAAIASDRPAFPPSAGGAAHTLRTSQSAFFRAAMGAQAPVGAPAAAASGDTPVRNVSIVPEPAANVRFQRPGSLLDIRV